MPELAEVHYYARQWDAGLGQPIHRVHLHPHARIFRSEPIAAFSQLERSHLLETRTHGKNLLFIFSHGHWLGGHLGMTGELLTAPPDHIPEKHDHLTLHTPSASLVFRDPRMFGRIRWHSGETAPPWWRALPPEILSPAFTVARIAAFLARRAHTPLKSLLLDQTTFPGIGNWMADEALWQLRLPPDTPAGTTPPAPLHRVLRKITTTALRTIGRDWSDPPPTWLFRHRWKPGGHCPRCQTPLTRADLRGRTACWCPQCQA